MLSHKRTRVGTLIFFHSKLTVNNSNESALKAKLDSGSDGADTRKLAQRPEMTEPIVTGAVAR